MSDPQRMAEAVAGRHRPRPNYPDAEIREALNVCRTHVPSLVAPPMCIAAGCNEVHPCPPYREAEEVLRTAGVVNTV